MGPFPRTRCRIVKRRFRKSSSLFFLAASIYSTRTKTRWHASPVKTAGCVVMFRFNTTRYSRLYEDSQGLMLVSVLCARHRSDTYQRACHMQYPVARNSSLQPLWCRVQGTKQPTASSGDVLARPQQCVRFALCFFWWRNAVANIIAPVLIAGYDLVDDSLIDEACRSWSLH